MPRSLKQLSPIFCFQHGFLFLSPDLVMIHISLSETLINVSQKFIVFFF